MTPTGLDLHRFEQESSKSKRPCYQAAIRLAYRQLVRVRRYCRVQATAVDCTKYDMLYNLNT